MASGDIGSFVIIFVIGFLIALAVAVAIRKRPGWGVALAVLVFVVAGLGYTSLRRERDSTRRAAYEARIRSVEVGHRVHPPMPVPVPTPLPAERPDPVARRIEVPDDVKAWARDEILGFHPPCPWLSEAESARTEALVGDTEFAYSEPVGGLLHGFSGQEAERQAAYRGARRAAERKLAVLALVVLKREDRRADVASIHPLALQLAGERIHEEARHLEKTRRSYGEVYRAAVAVRAGSEEVNGLAAAVRKELARGWVDRQRAMASWVVALGAALAIGFAVFLFYTFANAGTKGYFAWPLRIASLALFVLLCAGLFYLRVRLGMR